MCSVYEDDKNCACEEKPYSAVPSVGLCVKCKTSTDVLTIKSDEAFCKSCFVQRSVHKFRSEFGKSRLIRDRENVLVAYSGGLTSSALLHLVQEGVSRRALKKLRFSPSLLYIEDNFNLTQSERMANTEMVARKLHTSGLPYYICSLCQENEGVKLLLANDHSDPNFDLDSALNTLHHNIDTTVSTLFASVKTETSKQSLAYLMKNQALANMARTLGIGKVLVGDIANCIAVRIMSSIAQGRGAQIPYEASFTDGRHGDVVFVRPMREFTARELDVYCTLHDIQPLPLNLQAPKVDVAPSIESLTKNFVSTLQFSHDNTVPIICRTAEKLVMPKESETAKCDRCSLCKAVIDCAVPVVTSFRNESTDLPLQETQIDRLLPEEEIISQLCYGCRRLACEMTDPSKLLKTFRSEACTDRLRIQNAIKDFIIADEELG